MYVENMAPSVSVALPECENRPDIVEREGSRRWKLRREIIMDEILDKGESTSNGVRGTYTFARVVGAPRVYGCRMLVRALCWNCQRNVP
jgi:hypothetical protein